jgi:hypothetical protein
VWEREKKNMLGSTSKEVYSERGVGAGVWEREKKNRLGSTSKVELQ